MSAELKDTLTALDPGQAEDALFGLFAPFALTTFSDQIKKYRCSITLQSSPSPLLPLYSALCGKDFVIGVPIHPLCLSFP